MMNMIGPDVIEKKIERSATVGIVSEMLRDIFWKITDVDGIEKQQNMMMQLFKFLGGVKSLDECVQKLTALALSADKKEAEEEPKDAAEETITAGLESLYIGSKY